MGPSDLGPVLKYRLRPWPTWARFGWGMEDFGQGYVSAGVSHDSPRAQTCTFEGPGLQKHHQNSTIRPPETEKKTKMEWEWEKKERNFGRSRGQTTPPHTIWIFTHANLNHTQHTATHTNTHTHTNPHTQHTNPHTTQQHKQQHTHTNTHKPNSVIANVWWERDPLRSIGQPSVFS